jgi:ribosomal protein S18 acetylase RimI-like enzyme
MHKISLATKQDISRIVKIHKKCISETNAKFYDKKTIKNWLNLVNKENVLYQFEDSIWIIIKEDNYTVGFAQYDLKDNELYQIQIDPNYQGRGYGKELYDYIENDFRKNNKVKISLNATLNAVSFYKKLGFKEIKNISCSGIDMITMEKILEGKW